MDVRDRLGVGPKIGRGHTCHRCMGWHCDEVLPPAASIRSGSAICNLKLQMNIPSRALGILNNVMMDVRDEVGSGYAIAEAVYLEALPNPHAGQFQQCILESMRACHFCGVRDVSED